MGPSLLLRARGLDSFPLRRFPRAVGLTVDRREPVVDPTVDDHEVIARIAALDIGKAELVCCVRLPGAGPATRRMQEVRTYSTMTASLLGLADRLRGLGVTRVVMEATSDYWKPPFYLLDPAGLPGVTGQRQGCQAPARPTQNRPAGRGLVVQTRGTANAAPQLRATSTGTAPR
jgi:hypothetical protein